MTMYQIRMHSRGGQGGKTAAKILADAFFQEGYFVQAFSVYGAERRGAPVVSFIRVDKKPVLERGYITDPDCIIIMDDSLLKATDELGLLKGLDAREYFIVNTKEKMKAPKPHVKLVTVDASKIGRDSIGKEVFNTAMLGAFAGATKKIRVDYLEKAIHNAFSERHSETVAANIKAMHSAFEKTSVLR